MEEYKEFIDALVSIAESPTGQRVRAGLGVALGLGNDEVYNSMLRRLSTADRELLADLLDDARSGGIHDMLSLMTFRELELSRDGQKLAHEPFGTQAHYDFVSRKAGDTWPDEQGQPSR